MNRLLLGATLVGCLVCGILGSTLALGQEVPPSTGSGTPAEDKVTSAALPEREVSARIDAEIKKVWERDSINPAADSSDEEFVRRVYLDTVGTPPKADEVLAFLADKDKDKRRKLIDTLVADPRFGRHMADLWGNILLGRSGRDYGGSSHLFVIWLSERINKGDKFSDVVYDIVTASGSVSENPATAVYTREIPFKVANSAGNVMKNLTGVQLQCAECHDHPYEETWTEETFTGMASFWIPIQARVNNRNLPVDPTVEDEAQGRVIPESALERLPAEAQNRALDVRRYSKPVTMDGVALKTTNRKFWRPAIAKWMVADANKQTARYMANRFWGFAFGIGLHNPIDDFNSINEASHPELLEFLAQDFIDNDYDLKRMYRAILNSKTYQLSGKNAPKKAEGWHFASAPLRQMTPEQFFGSLMEIAGGNELARVLRGRNGSVAAQVKRRYESSRKRMEKAEDGQRDYSFDEETLNRIVAWYDKMEDSWYMRRSLAQGYARVGNDDEMTEVEGFSLTIDQALLVMNGEVTASLSGASRGSVVWKLVNELKTDEARIESLYLTVFGRKPESSETRMMKEHVRGTKNATEAYEDMMFAMLASTEFATNH